MSNPNSQGNTSPPNFSKEYERGLKVYLKYLPQELQQEYAYRAQYDPQFIEQAMGLQERYDPRLAQEQFDALQRRDPQWVALHGGLGDKIKEALDRGYLDKDQEAAYRRLAGIAGTVDPRYEAMYGKLAASAGKGEPTRDAAYQALGQQVTGDTLRGGTASPETLRQMTQAILSRQPGLSYGEAQDMAAAVYTGQRSEALKTQRQGAAGQFLQQATPTSQREQSLGQALGVADPNRMRQQSLGQFYGLQAPEQNVLGLAGTYIQPSNSIVNAENAIGGVQAPRSFGYVNPNAGYQGAQFGLQNYQNQLASANQSGSSNPWTNALSGAATGANYGSIGGGYGAAGGAIVGAAAGAFGYPQYSTILLKTDVKKVGEHNGLDIVEFRYKGRQVHYRGVIAEQVREKFPEAVGVRNGYLTVDYDKLGIPMERECRYCKQFKPLIDFHKASNGTQGRRSHCRECYNARERKVRDFNGTMSREYHAEYYRKHKEKYQVMAIMRDFKCTRAEAMRLYTIRKVTEACAICGESPSKRGFVIDHCHKSNKFRGMLCDKCNKGLGHFSDDPLKLQKAIVYLLKYLDSEPEVN